MERDEEKANERSRDELPSPCHGLADALISFDEASAILREAAGPLEEALVAIGEAAGLRLSRSVEARIDAPRFDVSAMDGYAVRDADLPGPLRIAGKSYAGSQAPARISQGEAVRIFTGAPVPEGADRVLVQEIVEARGHDLKIVGDYGEARHIRARGSDFREGDTLLEAGTRLGPRQLVGAAAADCAEVRVWRAPRVAFLATGDELVPPGAAADRPGALPDSITPALAEMARHYGATVAGCAVAPDDADRIEQLAAQLLDGCDVLVTIGGASVGERDFANRSIKGQNFRTLFSRIAMRPGKPVWCAKGADGRFVLGLPGNPTSALVTARLFLAPLVTALAGGGYDEVLGWRELELAEDLPAPGLREHFGRGALRDGKAVPFANQQSGAQALLARADLLLRQAGGSVGFSAGQSIQALDF